jgi:outer membrane protein TolC
MGKMLLSSLSQIRNLFWDYYEQNSIAIIHKEDLSRAELFLNIERIKFRNGECSQLDTLSAALQYLTASQSVLDSDILIENTRKNLSLALMLSSDSVSIDMSIDVSIAPLPNPEILIAQMKQYNPSLKIFEILHEKITLEKAKSKNDRLPMLDIVGTINHSRSGPKILSRQTDETNAVISCILSYALPTKPLSLNQKSLALQEKTNQLNETKFHQDMHVKLDQLGKSWEQELMRIALSEKSCAISRQQLTIAQKEYQLGTIDRLVLLDAQKNLVAQETSLIRSKINMKKLQIILDELTGSILNQFNLTILQNN